MEQFQAIPKQWGNSLGITIPAEVTKREHVKLNQKITVLIIGNQQKKIKQLFGSFKFKKNTQQIMREIDEGYDEH